jgi:hypothetical protein
MRTARLMCCILLVVLAPTVSVAGAVSHGGGPTFKLLAQTQNHWSVEYTPGSFPRTPLSIAGEIYQSFGSDAISGMTTVGAPQIPVECLTVGVPWGSMVEASLVDPVYEDQSGVLVAPCPGHVVDDDHQTTASYVVDKGAYAQNRFLPSKSLISEPPITVRQQRIATIRIAPYLYNPSTRHLRRLVKARLDINLVRDSSVSQQRISTLESPGSDPLFENVYKSLMWNYEEAKSWRASANIPGVQDATRDWFNLGQKYYRVPIAVDGWYRLTAQDLNAVGVAVTDPSRLQMFYKGKEIPILVREDSSICFYGRRNYGDTTYDDFYTDTSSFWLTSGNQEGLRYVPTSTGLGGDVAARHSSPATIHQEENTDYYEGTGEAEITNNGTVPGEGWVWEYYYPGTTLTHTFMLDSIDAGQGTAAVRVRLCGTTLHSITPDHHAQMWVNDSLAGEIDFDGRAGVVFSRSIPTAWLVQGVNQLRIASSPTANSINQFYLDWYEIDYPRILRTVDGQLTFTLGPGAPGRASISGLPGPEVDVVDISTGRLMHDVLVTGDSSAGFTATFQDTLSSFRHYMVCAHGAEKPCSIMPSKIFMDLRSSPAGADYIIVTHADFLPAAQRLAVERHSFNGVRTAVADVQDIYDEFNYGEASASAIKAYLRNAYATWPAPAPVYLLLLGDASWDPHRYMKTSTRTDYVPAYGVPAGDNWYGCFDPVDSMISSLAIGRVCVQNPAQAAAVVDKLIGFDRTPLGDWDKRFMFITGGNTAYEQADFNATTESQIGSYVSPAPVGGTALRVYKSSPSVIDGEHKEEMRSYVKEGVGFINFLGHSGGRTWGVDIGSPYDMENTNGQLPFVSSVSCNVGAFAEPSGNVLSEDFVLAENRAGIGVWSSSSLGYAYTGSLMVGFFLDGMSKGQLRELGMLTSMARYRLQMSFGSGSITETMLNCTPLQGDPLSRFPLPLQPDLGISPSDISMLYPPGSVQETPSGLKIRLHNYGLVTPDSVQVSVTDVYGGKQSGQRQRVGPQYHLDSLSIPWATAAEPGKHSIIVSLDPDGVIAEVSKLNNVASIDTYIYMKTLLAIKPVDNAMVTAGTQKLTVGLPGPGGVPGLQVVFELDTVASFSSPYVIRSSPITPGSVSAEWETPSLGADHTLFWRARTVNGEALGSWVVSSFTTSTHPPTPPTVRRFESSAGQFSRDLLDRTVATDSGVTIAPNQPLQLWSRSYGIRGGIANHIYSRIGINDQVIWGYEWEVGQSFMGIRVNEFDGSYLFGTFDVKNDPTRADSLTDFINLTPPGNYIVLSVIFDGHTNVTDSLILAIESIGSTGIRNLLPGQSWAFIGRKGYPGDAIEQLTNDSAVVSLQVPNFYSYANGTVSSQLLTAPVSWTSFHWRGSMVPGVTTMRMAVLGIRPTGAVDTLKFLPPDSTDIGLGFLNGLQSQYSGYRFLARLATADALRTPILKEWWSDAELPGDLAISSQSIGSEVNSVARGTALQLPVTVHNLGYRAVDSSRVTVSLYDETNTLRPMLATGVGAISVDSSKTIVVPLATQDLPARSSLRIEVDPISGNQDLSAGNNGADFAFAVTGGSSARVQVSADGVSLMDGDYVSAAPKMLIHLANVEDLGSVHQSLEAFVDGVSIVNQQEKDLSFTPSLAMGKHDLSIVARISNALGFVDSLRRNLVLNVVDEYRILQLYNYPNPFSGETYFSFVLTGARPPEGGTIRVYTVAGRKIRQIPILQSSLQIGVNKVYWDGRDNDGDEVANGYYFYQVQVTAGEKTESAIGKMVRVR